MILNTECAQRLANLLQLLTKLVWAPDIDEGMLQCANPPDRFELSLLCSIFFVSAIVSVFPIFRCFAIAQVIDGSTWLAHGMNVLLIALLLVKLLIAFFS